jgi:hypothetical protein
MDLCNRLNFRSIISVYRLAIVAGNTVCNRKSAGVEKIVIQRIKEAEPNLKVESWLTEPAVIEEVEFTG